MLLLAHVYKRGGTRAVDTAHRCGTNLLSGFDAALGKNFVRQRLAHDLVGFGDFLSSVLGLFSRTGIGYLGLQLVNLALRVLVIVVDFLPALTDGDSCFIDDCPLVKP